MKDLGEGTSLPPVAVEFIAEVVGQMRCPRYLREEVRQELSHHFEDALVYTQDESARIVEAEELVKAFGDAGLLAELSQRAKRRGQRGRLSAVLGLGWSGGLIALTMAVGGRVDIFINIPSFILVLLVPLCMGLATYGALPLLQALRDTLALVTSCDPARISSFSPIILNRLARYSYSGCTMGMLVGLVCMVSNLGRPDRAGPAFAIVALVPLYALVMAEFIYRPAARRAGFLVDLVGRTARVHVEGSAELREQ